MNGGPLHLVLLGALALLLVSAGIQDARTREIANWKNAAIALLAPLWWWSNGLLLWPDIAAQLLLAIIVFALFCGAFALNWMGGGDVKMIGALALWLPFQPLTQMLLAMSLLGGALTLVLMAGRAWRKKSDALEVPYGVAIAIAALIVFHQPFLNQFR